MRVLLFSLAAILVVCTTANSQLIKGRSNLVVVVTRATDQILAAADSALANVARQRDLVISAYETLSSRDGVTGPIPAVFEIAKYWNANLLRYSQIVTDQADAIDASIIAAIHDEVQQLTECYEEDVNELIARFVESFQAQIASVRQASNRRLDDIVSTGGAIAIRLNQLALQDCGGHLGQLNDKLIQVRQQIVAKILNEWAQRQASIRLIIVVHINELLNIIQEFAPCTAPCHAIEPSRLC